MAPLASVCILTLTVGLSLSRPGIWRIKFDHAPAAALGALLCVVLGIVPFQQLLIALHFLVEPVITIVSLMTITIIAEQTGLFAVMAHLIAKAARGNTRGAFSFSYSAPAPLRVPFLPTMPRC